MEKLARTLIEELKKQKSTLVLAESCTGGLVAAGITSISGASEVFDRAFITYSNKAKTEMLGVPAASLTKHGAVSPETARDMAVGAIKKSGAVFSAAITGVAGPGGGSKTKPIGLVYIAIAKKNEFIMVRKNNFPGNREKIRELAAKETLNMLLEALKTPARPKN